MNQLERLKSIEKRVVKFLDLVMSGVSIGALAGPYLDLKIDVLDAIEYEEKLTSPELPFGGDQ